MNRYFIVFLFGLFSTLVLKAVQNGPMDDYETTYGFGDPDISRSEVASFFDGQNWLENKITSKAVNLNKIYQENAFTRKLSTNSHIKRYQRSYGTYIEARVCDESPYIDKPVRANMTSKYGYRTHPMSGRRHIHAGIDFRGKTGTPVLAGSAGRVKTVRRKGAYGKTIVIDHGNSYSTLYGHLSGYAVREGQWVNLGQTIGYIGRTGRATGPHLHFEVRCHNVPLNPLKYLGKMGQIAEIKFKRRNRGNFIAAPRRPIPQRATATTTKTKTAKAPVKRDPNYYTRMINLQKLKKLQEKVKKF